MIYVYHILSSVLVLSRLWVKGTVYLHLLFNVLEALMTGGQINSVLEQFV